jgi:hypothetical protein
VDTLAYGNLIWHYTVDQPVAVYRIPVSWVAPPQNKNVRSEK